MSSQFDLAGADALVRQWFGTEAESLRPMGMRWACGGCGRTDSVNRAPKLDLVVCLACGYEETGEAASVRLCDAGPRITTATLVCEAPGWSAKVVLP